VPQRRTPVPAELDDGVRELGVLMPEDVNEPGRPARFNEPRATDHIDEMRESIDRLLKALQKELTSVDADIGGIVRRPPAGETGRTTQPATPDSTTSKSLDVRFTIGAPDAISAVLLTHLLDALEPLPPRIPPLTPQQATKFLDWPLASALACVLMLITLGMVVAFNRVLRLDKVIGSG